MEKIVETIIEIEEKAQKLCEDAVQRRENFAQTLSDDLEKMDKDINERAQRRIGLIYEQENAYAQQIAEKTKAHYAAALTKMDELFQENRKKWEDEIFSQIIRP